MRFRKPRESGNQKHAIQETTRFWKPRDSGNHTIQERFLAARKDVAAACFMLLFWNLSRRRAGGPGSTVKSVEKAWKLDLSAQVEAGVMRKV